jgi:hypothetical protein
MLRRITAFGSAALVAFTVATTPLYAADLGMPTKAPPIAPAAVEEICIPCLLALVGVGVCLAVCGCFRSCETQKQCVTTPCS